MKKPTYHILPCAAALLLAATSCGTPKHTDKAVTVSPSPCMLVADRDGNAQLDATIEVPENYISRRSRLIILPQLVAEDSVVDEYDPVVIDAPIFSKKQHRLAVLHGYVDPYAAVADARKDWKRRISVPCSRQVTLPQGMAEASLIGVVTTDGCGICTSQDTIAIADIINYQILLGTDLRIPEMHAPFVVQPKIHKGRGEARLQFVVDKWDIRLDMANNRAELQAMLDTLRPVVTDSLMRLTSLSIKGSASAEASYSHNVMLANNRAASARDWLVAQLNMPASERKVITIGAAPEGWEPVVQAMRAAGDPDSVKVREIMIKYPGPTDDAAEPYIRRLACWPRIRDRYLAKDRKVMYEYTWEMRNYTTDAELLDMWHKRPDTFNEPELLHVATLVEPGKDEEEVYRYTLERFPQCTEAKVNLARLWLDRGDMEQALPMLEQIDLPEARYIRGVYAAQQGDLELAASLLPQEGDINAAVVAIGMGDYDRARRIMETCTDADERAATVRRIIAKGGSR